MTQTLPGGSGLPRGRPVSPMGANTWRPQPKEPTMTAHFLRQWSDDLCATIPEPHFISTDEAQWDALDDVLKHLDDIDLAIEAHELALASTRATPGVRS